MHRISSIKARGLQSQVDVDSDPTSVSVSPVKTKTPKKSKTSPTPKSKSKPQLPRTPATTPKKGASNLNKRTVNGSKKYGGDGGEEHGSGSGNGGAEDDDLDGNGDVGDGFLQSGKKIKIEDGKIKTVDEDDDEHDDYDDVEGEGELDFGEED